MAEVWLTTTRNGIRYSPTGEVRERYVRGQQNESTIVVLVKWDDRYAFCLSVLPGVRVGPRIVVNPANQGTVLGDAADRDCLIYGTPRIVDSPRYSLLRDLPERHPQKSNMWVDEVEILEGKGVPIQVGNSFDFRNNTSQTQDGYARIALTYRSFPYEINVNNETTNAILGNELPRYVKRNFKPSSEKIIPKGDINGLVFHEEVVLGMGATRRVGDNTAIARTAGQSHVIYTWYAVPKVPPCIFHMMGCVNSTEFDTTGLREILGDFEDGSMPGLGCQPGKMLYLTPEISEPYYMFDGTKVWDITYHMSLRPTGWNNVWRPLISNFRRLFIPFRADLGHTQNIIPGYFDPLERWRNPSDYADLNNLFVIT